MREKAQLFKKLARYIDRGPVQNSLRQVSVTADRENYRVLIKEN